MTGQWEKYVELAAQAQEQFWAPLRGHTDYPDEIDFGLARAVLAVVGPLIAEDTRVRMVEAAGRAVEREGAADAMAKVRALHAAKPVPQPSQFVAWCNECSCTWPCATAKILDASAEDERAVGGQISGPNEAYGLRPCCPSPAVGPHTIVCLVGRGALADPRKASTGEPS